MLSSCRLQQQYQQQVNEGLLTADPAQQQAVFMLEQLANALNLKNNTSTNSPLLKGIYLWGKVGRGKTMLMDMFFDHVATNNKKRIHFHHFMESVHQRLKTLTGKVNPLNIIAKEWAKNIKLLCFDEFFVNDIGDAMLLAGLFECLFKQGVVLVATSNCQPEQLYKNGLQRQRFLPTIALLNQHCHIVNINGEQDHRLRHLQQYTHYFFPLEQGQQKLLQYFNQKTGQLYRLAQLNNQQCIVINQRNIHYLAKSKHIIWFDFWDLCSGPRSQRDYIALAKQFSCVFVSNVPQFSGSPIPAVFSGIEDCYQRDGILLQHLRKLDDEARRFIALVDEFYDQKVELYLSAESDIFQLYQAEQLAFEFARCESRLIEMQTLPYN